MLALFFVGGRGTGVGFGWFNFKFVVVGVVVAAAIRGMAAIVGVALSERIHNCPHLSAFLRMSTSDPHMIRIHSASVRNV